MFNGNNFIVFVNLQQRRKENQFVNLLMNTKRDELNFTYSDKQL